MSRSSIRVLPGTLQVAEITGHAHVAHHRAADVDHLAAVGHGGVQHLLHPVHVRGEAGHDHPLLAGGEDPLQRRGDVALRRDEAGDLGVGRVDHEQVDALGSPSRAKARRSVSRPSSGSWSILKSPVCRIVPAGVRTATASASGIEWLTAMNSRSKSPMPDPVAVGDHPLIGVAQPVLAELLRQQGQGQLGADQRDVRPLPQQVRHRADVVLVSVGQHQPDHVVQPVGDRVEARAGSGRRRDGRPRGTARRSRSAAAGRRTPAPPCSGRRRRARPAG